MIRLMRERDDLSVVADQIGTIGFIDRTVGRLRVQRLTYKGFIHA